jgi:hypothetical protein
VTPFDTISLLSIGFLFMFEKHVRMDHLLAFAPAVIALAFSHDFFGLFLGNDGVTGDVVMGISIVKYFSSRLNTFVSDVILFLTHPKHHALGMGSQAFLFGKIHGCFTKGLYARLFHLQHVGSFEEVEH